MITSIRLKNFKNFADETLRLGPFTVIVGANASGKSNIRDAFRFLHGIGRGYALADIVGGKYGAGGQKEREKIRGAIKEIVRFGQHSFSIATEFKGIYGTFERYTIGVGTGGDDDSGFRVREEELHTTKHGKPHTCSLEGDGEPFLLRMAERRSNINPVSSLAPRSDRSVPAHPHIERVAMVVAVVFHCIRFLDPVPDRVRQPSPPRHNVLGDGGENLPTVMQEICNDAKRKAALIEWTRELTPMDVENFRFSTDSSGRIHLLIQEKGGEEVPAYSASDGTLRFLALLAALIRPAMAGLYFIEEIENGIHPSRLHLLLDLIETQTEKGKFQVVATTHSPALLTAMSDRTFEDASVVCRLPGTTDAIIRPVRALPDAAELRKTQGLGRLLEGGWMETALAFTEDNRNGEGGAE